MQLIAPVLKQSCLSLTFFHSDFLCFSLLILAFESWIVNRRPTPPDHFSSPPSRLLKVSITFHLPVSVETSPTPPRVDSSYQGGTQVTFSKLNYIQSQALKNPLPSDLIASPSTSNMSVTEVRPLALIQGYNWIWKPKATLLLDSI